MRLPWNRKYLIIGFHVAVAFGAIYLIKLLLDGAAHIAGSLPAFGQDVTGFFGWLGKLFSPLVIALIISYLLDPAVDFFQKIYDKALAGRIGCLKKKLPFKKKPVSEFKSRSAGVALAFLVLFAVLGLFVTWVARSLNLKGDTVDSLAAAAQTGITNFMALYAGLQEMLAEVEALSFIAKYLNDAIDAVGYFIQNLATGLISSISDAGGNILNFFLGLILAFYLMSGKGRILHGIASLARIFLPQRMRRVISRTAGDIDHVLTGYIRGMLTDVLIVAIMISVYLLIIRVDFAVILGIITGLANIIPYFGAFFGLIFSVLVALLSGDPWKALYAGIGIFVLQQVDGMIINPRILGNSVELSPIAVIIALSVAGTLFGITGMILAAPACAVLKVFAMRYIEHRRVKKALKELGANEAT
jgi:predicted PurR-regulated permease PerM